MAMVIKKFAERNDVIQQFQLDIQTETQSKGKVVDAQPQKPCVEKSFFLSKALKPFVQPEQRMNPLYT
jgi:hypothetical protein